MTNSLAGKKVFIAGATGYIGQAIAKGMAEKGAKLALHYFSNHQAIEQLCHAIAESESPCEEYHAFQADVRSSSDADQVVEQAWQALDGIDVVINCMGHAIDNSIVFLKQDDIQNSLKSNLNTVVNLCEPLAKKMSSQGSGSIINISSITGLVGQPMRSAYGACKSAVIAYSKSLARDVASSGVRVNCLAPQVVEGGLANDMKGMIKVIMEENTPIKEPCQAEHLLPSVFMLADENSPFITGEVVNITGGLVTW